MTHMARALFCWHQPLSSRLTLEQPVKLPASTEGPYSPREWHGFCYIQM